MSWDLFADVREIQGFNSIAEKALLCHLALCENAETGKNFPKHKTLAAYMDCDEDTIGRVQKRLVALGFLERHRDETPVGMLGRYSYRVLVPDPLPQGFWRMGDDRPGAKNLNDGGPDLAPGSTTSETSIQQNRTRQDTGSDPAPYGVGPDLAPGRTRRGAGSTKDSTKEVQSKTNKSRSHASKPASQPSTRESERLAFEEGWETWPKERKDLGTDKAFEAFCAKCESLPIEPAELAKAMKAYAKTRKPEFLGENFSKWLEGGYPKAAVVASRRAAVSFSESVIYCQDWIRAPSRNAAVMGWPEIAGAPPGDPGCAVEAAAFREAMERAVNSQATFDRAIAALETLSADEAAAVRKLDADLLEFAKTGQWPADGGPNPTTTPRADLVDWFRTRHKTLTAGRQQTI